MRNTLKISTVILVATMLSTAPVSALSLGLGGSGGLLTLGGDGGTSNSTVSLDTSNLLGGTATGGNLLGGNLLGSSGPTTADINLGGTGGTGPTNANLLLDLFGDGSGPNARATLGSGLTGGSNNLILDLFGNGSGSGGNGSGSGANGGAGVGGGSGGSSFGGVRLASIDSTSGPNCFTPNAKQISTLVNRHAYVDSTLAGMGQASNIKIVDVGLCKSAGAAIASQSNVSRLQDFVAAHPALRDGLARLGRAPSDVIGADKSGGTLVVYVM